MNISKREAVSRWLADQGLRDTSVLASEDYTKVQALLGADRPGLGILWSMIMFERQQANAKLINADFGTPQGAVAAAKLQGMVMMVDIIREILLDISDPIGEGSDADEEIAGVRFNYG